MCSNKRTSAGPQGKIFIPFSKIIISREICCGTVDIAFAMPVTET